MVGIPGRVPNSANRLGLHGAKPLSARWDAAVDLLHRISPGTPVPVPANELNLDRVLELVAEARVRATPPEPDPQTRAAADEFFQLQRDFNSVALQIKQAQRWLITAKDNWRHKLLKDISPDCFQEIAPYDTAVGDFPFHSAYEARVAAKDMLQRVLWLRGIWGQISEAKSFEAQTKDLQALDLVKALAGRFTDFENRIAAVEAHNMALEARIGRLERGNKPAKKSKRPKSSSNAVGTHQIGV